MGPLSVYSSLVIAFLEFKYTFTVLLSFYTFCDLCLHLLRTLFSFPVLLIWFIIEVLFVSYYVPFLVLNTFTRGLVSL